MRSDCIWGRLEISFVFCLWIHEDMLQRLICRPAVFGVQLENTLQKLEEDEPSLLLLDVLNHLWK